MSIRLGGLISGMDTQTIIDKLLQAARKPLETLTLRKSKLELKKTTFKDIDSQLSKLQKALLDLRLESTFKTKKVASSDDRYVTGQAGVAAAPGIHTVSISQLASSAVARSQYTRAVLTTSPANTAGISSITGRPRYSLEGDHEIAVTDEGSYYRARSLFKPLGGGQFQTLAGSAAESGTVEGTIGQDIGTGSNKLVLTVNGETVTVFLDDAVAHATAMARVAADAEDKINAALNSALDTKDITYVVVRTSRDPALGTDAFTIYNVSGSGNVTIDTGQTTAAALGFSSGGTAGTANAVTTDVTAKTLSGLLIQMNEPLTGLIRGISFTSNGDTGLTAGEATVHVSPSLNARGPSKSRVDGGAGVSSSGTLNLTVKGLQNAGFANAPSTDTNGSFSINGVKITINNYRTLSVNDVLGMINGSAAGVTATYDSAHDRIVLTSLQNSSTSITLGDATDTSDFLTIAKLTANEGASFTMGSSSTSISTSSSLSSAGFTLTPTSGTFTINGVTLYVDATKDTVEDLITKINNSSANVTARYDALVDKFILSSTMGKADSNTRKITLGSLQDSSNILRALNLVGEEYASKTSTLAPTGNRSADTITKTTYGATSGTSISIPATTGTAAYQASAGVVNWVDGIAQGAVFSVLAGEDGATSFTWSNGSGATISTIDAFVNAWNNPSNWSGSRVEVGVIKEGEDKLRFFSRPTSATASSHFTITAPSAFDLYELGLVNDPPQEFGADSNTAALWHFDETSGAAAADSSVNGVHAVIEGATHVPGSFFYNSLYFDGTDDKVTASGNGSLNLNGSTQMALEVWINPEVLPAGTAYIVEKNGSGYELSLDSGGHVVFTIWDSGGAHTFTTASTVNTGEWTHITASYNYGASPNQLSVTINGTTESGSGTGGWVDGQIVDGGDDLTLGDSFGGGNRFQGFMDEVRISTTARTPTADGSWSQTFTNAAATANAQYNALNLAYAVNTTSGAGIKATTDDDGYVTFTSTVQGYGGGFTLSDDATESVSTILDYFGSSSVSVQLQEHQEAGTRGQDAIFSVDGVSYMRTINRVSDIIQGLTVNLHAPTATPVTLTISNDKDKALDKLTEFIAAYNETMDKLNPPLLSKEQKKYLEPLSDKDRAKMTFTEIEEYEDYYQLYNGWEFIRRESSLRMLYSSLRSITTSEVSGLSSSLNSLQEIGISPGSIGGFEDAKNGFLLLAPTGEDNYRETIRSYLELNADLLNALENNADKVYQLFAYEGSGQNGIARRLDNTIDNYTETYGILDRQIRINGTIDQELTEMEKDIEAMEDRLSRQEERLWEEFNRLEEELARLNAQSNTLSSLMASLGMTTSKQ
jgi:flagellar capping protein FliD